MVKVNINGCRSFADAAGYESYVRKALDAYDTLQAGNGVLSLPVSLRQPKTRKKYKTHKYNGNPRNGG